MTPARRTLPLVLLALCLSCTPGHAYDPPLPIPDEPTVEQTPPGEHSVEVASVGDHNPKIIVPAVTPVGEPIEASFEFTPHEGMRSKVQWSSDSAWRPKPGAKPAIYLWAKPGLHWVAVTVVVVTADDIQLHQQRVEFTVGDPPPPAPLASLVTKEQAATLSLFYRAALSTVPQIETAEAFYTVHKARMEALDLDGSPFEAAVLERFRAAIGEHYDGVKLVGALEGVIKELGAPPVKPPPVDPVDPVDPIDPTTPATAATYIYEKDEAAPPSPVLAGINRLRREKRIVATTFEDDSEDGDGDVPDQYKVPLAAARQVGLPAFVVLAGDKLLNAVKDPRTEEQIWGAVP